MAVHCHNTPGLPGETLSEIHDMLTLALDATARPSGYSQGEREARSYMRTALRRTQTLLEGRV
ncbi:hypothetical protein GVY41_09080 [Frigidibacter albus]|uniref:Uncharacterized protein n=1 Tax=Frigidibacter albus TaxID=1465486 RepID=A0A6L8VG04_9RHOB|nr:hypothetical protein [Frigidibacter albus]MZQ89245.1 hypothetical protein [Frigidibacter albus]NBE31151.1 hypothetical protein [Frigidibacter albus]GGH53146.1 hypothetical protein GCM10011341_18340 [Frigidibacter albus]